MASRSVVAASRRRIGCTPTQYRAFTSSARCMVNPLLNLSHFSAAKEAQFFSKERKMPQTEFHPYLELIRSSEVDIFAPAPGASATVVAALEAAQRGKLNAEATQRLAMDNLLQQVRAARYENLQTRMTLQRVHEKYKREERNAFIIMLASVALLSGILVKTDALQDLKVYAQDLNSQWKGFDWEWLGNPPSYRHQARYSSTPATTSNTSSFVISTPNGTPIYPIEAQSDHLLGNSRPVTPPHTITQMPSRWTLSRLFWAAPEKVDS